MFFFDSYYIILVLPALVFALYAQFKVKSTFNKYYKIGNSNGLTGADVARRILENNNIFDVNVERVAGNLTDHYDPKNKVLRLSEKVYGSNSVAAVGVAAHETGHAIQHSSGYAPLGLRSSIVLVANVGSSIGPIMAIVGMFLRTPFLIQIGILLYAAAVVFTIITLPVEFNASSRAIKTLEGNGILNSEEIRPAKKVLSAAAMTYVASAAVAIMSLIRLILLSRD
jgi:Zn-dependent membrane protease YugP